MTVKLESPLRFGAIGGGEGSLIGDSHRVAASRDGCYDLVAGAFDQDPARSRAFGLKLGLEPGRAYGDYREMLEAEAARDDGVEIVAVMTPNATHYEIAKRCLANGLHVICEKPLTFTSEQSLELVRMARERSLIAACMYGYSGFPMVRQARAMVRAGQLGEITLVHAEFAHGGGATAVELDNAAAAWRVSPEVAGPSYVVGDLGTHAAHLAEFITGHRISEVAADRQVIVAGRALEDNAHLMLHFEGGASGTLWASAVAVGHRHGLRIRVYGREAGLEWQQEYPNQLGYARDGESARTLEMGSPELLPPARRLQRIAPGHAMGYFEAFSNVYSDVAECMDAVRSGRDPDPLALEYPDFVDGAHGVRIVEAFVESAANGARWTSAALSM
ncbi:MAG: Gfo/Idh/MocA family protein [Gammaproteobacteria bacterium]